VKEYLIPSYGYTGPFITGALEAESYEQAVENNLFEGDEEELPNSGWVWSKRDTDLEDRERYFEEGDEGVRRWGYVMWDQERLDEWGVLGSRK
jgi:hypothetical protein